MRRQWIEVLIVGFCFCAIVDRAAADAPSSSFLSDRVMVGGGEIVSDLKLSDLIEKLGPGAWEDAGHDSFIYRQHIHDQLTDTDTTRAFLFDHAATGFVDLSRTAVNGSDVSLADELLLVLSAAPASVRPEAPAQTVPGSGTPY